MKILRDAKGGEWALSLRLPTLDRIKAGCGVNFMDVEMKSIDEAFKDLILVSRVLYYACKSEAKERDMDLEKFQDQWDMETLLNSLPLIMEELAEFYPPWMRSQLTAAAAQFRKGVKETAEKLEQLTPEEIERQIKELAAGATSPTPLEDSLESTPTTSP